LQTNPVRRSPVDDATDKGKLGRLRCFAALFAVILLAGVSAHSGALALRETGRQFKAGTPDFAVAYAAKLAPARAVLPDHGTLGYVSDSSDEGEFYLTQYLVVPLVLKKSPTPDIVLVNNHVAKPTPAEIGVYRVSRLADGSAEYDFGNGMLLIDRRHEVRGHTQ
jgi:hypothetical protein